MKLKYSLSLKITLIIVILSTIIIFALASFNINRESRFVDSVSKTSQNDLINTHGLVKTLDENIEGYFYSNNTKGLQEYIFNFTKEFEKIPKVNIVTMTDDGLRITLSSDNDSIGIMPNQHNKESFEKGDIFYILPEENYYEIIIISPINISGDIVGTYEVFLELPSYVASLDTQVKNIVIISFIFILALIFSLLFLLRKAIVKPIITFRDAARVIGEGDLNKKIKIESGDELGELANAFNQMTKDLKKSKAEIEKYNKLLERLLDQKDEFIGQLGHDLKNPLTPLVGLLPLIAEKEKDPKIKEHLKIMNQNVEYMRDLILKTLQLARLRSDKTKFDFENLDLYEELERVTAAQKLFLDQHKIKLVNNVKKGTFVWADKLRLTELLNNLITNGVKYTPEGGGTITIDSKMNNDFVTVSVKDTGIGMNKEELSQIFDEFYKADQSRHELDSSGLGLTICKRIVEKHGGEIWVDSKGKGKGSTFYFTLKKGEEKINEKNK